MKSFVCLQALPTKMLHRTFKNWAKISVNLLAFLSLLWAIGAIDYLFQTDFSQFEWEPPGALLRHQIEVARMEQDGKRLDDFGFGLPILNDLDSLSESAIRPAKKCLNTTLNGTHRHSVLILVRSAPDRIERRLAIRTTWGWNGHSLATRFRTIFVMGSRLASESNDQREEFEADRKRYGDLLVGDFFDHYNNSTLKTLLALDFSVRHCPTAAFVLLIDDDELLLPWNLAEALGNWDPETHLYTGDANAGALPARLWFSKWQISLPDYPFNQFPPYVQGNAILLSRRTAREFHAAIKYAKLFVWDDVLLGIIARALNIEARPEKRMPRKLLASSPPMEGLISAHDFSAAQIRALYAEMCFKWGKDQQRC